MTKEENQTKEENKINPTRKRPLQYKGENAKALSLVESGRTLFRPKQE